LPNSRGSASQSIPASACAEICSAARRPGTVSADARASLPKRCGVTGWRLLFGMPGASLRREPRPGLHDSAIKS
jgi:hypothetical protein